MKRRLRVHLARIAMLAALVGTAALLIGPLSTTLNRWRGPEPECSRLDRVCETTHPLLESALSHPLNYFNPDVWDSVYAQNRNVGVVTSSSDQALSAFSSAALTNTGTLVVAGTHNLYGVSANSGSGFTCWLNVYDATSATPGVTTVAFSIPIFTDTAGGLNAAAFINPYALGNVSTGLSVSVTGAQGGAGTCPNTHAVTLFYK